MCAGCIPGPSRRLMLAGLAGATVAGCSENVETGRRQFVVVSDAQLAQMADQAWAQLRAQSPVVEDPAVQARLARVARPVVAAAGRPDLDWDFVVLEGDELNAFVLPNGKVGVYRGLMTFARDDELAAVIGHEVAHVLARHPAERVSQELALRVGVSLAQLLLAGEEGGRYGEITAAALGLGAVYGVLLPYSRRHELEADRVGVELMAEAGLAPQAAVRFWERMIARQSGAPQPLEALSTHPADARRLAELEAAVAAQVRTGPSPTVVAGRSPGQP